MTCRRSWDPQGNAFRTFQFKRPRDGDFGTLLEPVREVPRTWDAAGLSWIHASGSASSQRYDDLRLA